MVQLFAVIFLMLCSVNCFSETKIKCTPMEIKSQDKAIILPGVNDKEPARIYFFHNVSKKSLWLDHASEKARTAHAGWSSYLRPNNWSALLLNRKNFAISCAEIQPGEVHYHNCAKMISVCIPKTSYQSKRKGSYWLAEDHPWEDLLSALKKRGVALSEQQLPPLKK